MLEWYIVNKLVTNNRTCHGILQHTTGLLLNSSYYTVENKNNTSSQPWRVFLFFAATNMKGNRIHFCHLELSMLQYIYSSKEIWNPATHWDPYSIAHIQDDDILVLLPPGGTNAICLVISETITLIFLVRPI